MKSGRGETAPRSRRAEYAEFTRRAILDAARSLFVTQGYFGTKVEEIARTARVAPATVYAVGGGKNGLLRTLITEGTAAEDVQQIVSHIESITDPGELIRFIVHATRVTFEQWAGLMRQVVAAAPQEASVRESMQIAHASMRGGFDLVARRLAALGALRDDIDATRAGDVLWLHLCNAAYFIRTDDLGWPLDESEIWLNDTLPHVLLATPPQRTAETRARSTVQTVAEASFIPPYDRPSPPNAR